MNKSQFLYKYYCEFPLKRKISISRTARKVQKIINEIAERKNIPEIARRFTEKYNINMHALSSHWHLESLILSLASFYAFSREYAEVVIHEDGSFTHGDALIVKKLFPWIKYVSLKDADMELRKKGFSPNSLNLRRKHKLLIKAIDFHHIESKERILIIDTDIFLAGGMDELWDRIKEGAQFVFNGDPEPVYGSSRELLEKVLGKRIEIDPRPSVNTGLIVEPASILRAEKSTVESYCREFPGFPYKRIHAIEQGYIACILKDKKIREYALSPRYRIIGSQDLKGIAEIKKYDFIKNPDSLEAIHLCGWDKPGKDFSLVKEKLICAMEEKPLEVAFYPNTIFTWSNPLWRMLRDALSRQGVRVVKMKFSLPGLLRNKNRVKIIHFHYVYPDILMPAHMPVPQRIQNKIYSFISACQTGMFALKLKTAKLLGYKILYTVHNLDFHDTPDEKTENNLKLLYGLSDSIVAMGKDAREKLKQLTGREDIKLIPPFHFEGAYKNDITRETAREKLRIPGDKFVYLHFGNIKRYKGIDLLIKAFKKLKLDAILLLAGDSSLDPAYARELEDLIGNDDRIKIVEYKQPDDVQFFMNTADVAAFPFRQITNSSAVMLAKSFCKPTVCMNKGNTADYANPETDILTENEGEFEKALLKARETSFPSDKREYLKGVPSVEEVAAMHKAVYEKL